MEKREKDLEEEILGLKQKKRSGRMEAGRGKNGEPSADALKSWFIWAAAALFICLLVVLAGAYLSSGKNKRETAVLLLDAGPSVELGLNRKGVILRVDAHNESGASLITGMDLERSGLDKGMDLMMGVLADSGYLGDDKAMLLTLQKREEEENINIARMTEQAVLYVENALKRRQAGALIYIGTIQVNSEIIDLTDQYGITAGKAGLVKNLVDKNTKLKLEDTGRLARMEVQEIAEEISRNKYTTSFDLVAVKAAYEEKESEEETTEKGSEETSEENAVGTGESEGIDASESPEEKKEKEAAGTEKTTAALTQPESTKAPETAAPETTPASSETSAQETAPAEPASTAEPTAPAGPSVPAEPGTSDTPAAQDSPEASENPSPALEPETAAPAPETTPEQTVNPKGPGFTPENQAPEVKSPLEGPGA